jgi:hypothetical protein
MYETRYSIESDDMTAISSLTAQSPNVLAPSSKLAAVPANDVKMPDPGSNTLTLGRPNDDAVAYSLAQFSPTPVWERTARDSVSSSMAANINGARLAHRFDGLGAALLQRFKVDGSDFTQSVIQLPAGTPPDRVDESRFHAQAVNEIGLTVTARSGATVAVTLGSDKDRLTVQISVTNGELSDAERAALVELSEGFQKAIDGLAKVPPQLDIGNVLQFDAVALASVSLHASVELSPHRRQTIDVVADDKQRSLTATGSMGTIKLDVDMGDAAILGNEAQRQAALTRYLHQFDKAQRRGQGDEQLMALFKNGFSELHGNFRTAASPGQGLRFGTGDQGMMTGLADFSASVTGVTRAENPMRSDEADAFTYKVSQRTDVRGSGPLDRDIAQHQESTLDASFHRSLYPDTSLLLDASRYSQNYYYEQIHDKASTDMELAYDKGELVKASLTQSADQWQRTRKYQFARLEGDTTTPSSQSRTVDVLALVKAAAKDDGFNRMDDDARRDKVLADMHEHVLLESDAARLAD